MKFAFTLLMGLLGTASFVKADIEKADVVVVNKIRSGQNQPGNLAFLNLESGEVVSRINIGKEPHEVAVSPDGKYAVVTNTGNSQDPGHTLSVFDVAEQRELHRVDLGPLWNPHGVLAREDLFFFTAEGSMAIGAYKPSTNQVVSILGTGQSSTHMLAITKDGKTLVATSRGSSSISIFELKGSDPIAPDAWKETTVSICANPEGVDIAPNEHEAWVGCRGSQEVAIVDLIKKEMISSFPTHTKTVARVKFTLDGKTLLITDPEKGELLSFDPESHKELTRRAIGAACESIFLVPDGKTVLIGVTNDDNVAEVSLEDMSITRRLSTGRGPDAMAWIGKTD